MLHHKEIHKKYVILLLGIVCITGALVYSWLLWGPHKLPQDAEVAKQNLSIKITPETEMIQKIVYSKCNDEEVYQTKPADNLIGLNYVQVQKIYSGWKIEKFDTAEVEMTLTVDSFCREHANHMFIGIKDGYVAVYYGKPGSKPIVKEVTKILVNKLMPEDQEELKHGLVVQNREEMLRSLEGLQSR